MYYLSAYASIVSILSLQYLQMNSFFTYSPHLIQRMLKTLNYKSTSYTKDFFKIVDITLFMSTVFWIMMDSVPFIQIFIFSLAE